MKQLLTINAFVITLFLLAAPVFAQNQEILSSCAPIFGGGETCRQSTTLTLNKRLLSPTRPVVTGQSLPDDAFIENVTLNGTAYSPNQLFAVRLFITNTSNRELKNVSVQDILPTNGITFVRGDGKYDNTTRSITATLPSIKPKETKKLTFQFLTSRADQLGQRGICVINQAIVTAGRDVSQDNAQLCMKGQAAPQPAQNQTTPLTTPRTTAPSQPQTTKGGQTVFPTPQTQKTPETGAEVAFLAGLLPAGIAGWILRRKTV